MTDNFEPREKRTRAESAVSPPPVVSTNMKPVISPKQKVVKTSHKKFILNGTH